MRINAFFVICCLGCASATAQKLELPGQLDFTGVPPDQPNVRLWSEMDARDRAELWPYLDPVTRSVHWRDMTKQEREEMREFLSAAENEKIRRRYCVNEDQLAHMRPRPGVGLRDRDRSLMRQQIMEVHIEMGSRGPGGRPGPESGPRAHHLRSPMPGDMLPPPPPQAGGVRFP